MSFKKNIVLIATFFFIFFLVYFPHLNYSFPLHIDEWHHLSEGLRMGNYGEYINFLKAEEATRFPGLEMGFHFILFLLSGLVDLVHFYKFLPAIWAGITALVLFWVTYNKTNKNFTVGLLAMIFFASLKSNVNFLGLQFFTPLTFSIPFIFLYTYFFTEGIQKENPKNILVSLGIMIFLIPIHSLSVLFSLPLLFIYSLTNYKFFIKNLPLFCLFLLIPTAGLTFFKLIMGLSWSDTFSQAFNQLKFDHGWGVLEIKNSPTELYSVIGYLLALVGAGWIFFTNQTKKYIFYLVWPIILLIEIIIYRITGTSFFSPYQRNLYYFAISLPFLSALGMYYFSIELNKFLGEKLTQKQLQNKIKKWATVTIDFHLEPWQIKVFQKSLILITALVIFFLTFNNYYKTPPDLAIYHTIDADDYQALKFLATLPDGKVMATPFMSTAVYPIAKKKTVANLVFYGDVKNIENFFLFTDCNGKELLIKKFDIRYIISPAPLECNYKVVYAQKDNIIYETSGPI